MRDSPAQRFARQSATMLLGQTQFIQNGGGTGAPNLTLDCRSLSPTVIAADEATSVTVFVQAINNEFEDVTSELDLRVNGMVVDEIPVSIPVFGTRTVELTASFQPPESDPILRADQPNTVSVHQAGAGESSQCGTITVTTPDQPTDGAQDGARDGGGLRTPDVRLPLVAAIAVLVGVPLLAAALIL